MIIAMSEVMINHARSLAEETTNVGTRQQTTKRGAELKEYGARGIGPSPHPRHSQGVCVKVSVGAAAGGEGEEIGEPRSRGGTEAQNRCG